MVQTLVKIIRCQRNATRKVADTCGETIGMGRITAGNSSCSGDAGCSGDRAADTGTGRPPMEISSGWGREGWGWGGMEEGAGPMPPARRGAVVGVRYGGAGYWGVA